MSGSLVLTSAGGRKIDMSKLQTAFDLNDRILTLTRMRAGLWGGEIQVAEARVNTKTSDWETGGVTVQGIQLPQASLGLGLKTGPAGVIDGSLEGTGGGTLESLKLRGLLRSDAATFAFRPHGGLARSAGNDRKIEFGQFQSDFSFQDQTLLLQAVAGDLWGGRMQMDNAIWNLNTSTSDASGAQLQDVRIQSMRSGLGMEDKPTRETLHGTWQGGGGMGLTSMSGQGT